MKPVKKTIHKFASWREAQDKFIEEERQVKLEPKTANHRRFIRSMQESAITFCSGPAGTGKSTYACKVAAQLLKDKQIQKILISRPLVTCGAGGRGLGFLKGDLSEKVGPYMQPLLNCLKQFIPAQELESLIQKEIIELKPLELMRGESIKNTFMFLDEAQNVEFSQLHMYVTRIAEGSRMVIAGDATSKTQTDLDHHGENPFAHLMRRFRHKGQTSQYSIVEFTRADIVRHPFLQWIDEACTEDIPIWKPEPQKGHVQFKCPNCGSRCEYFDPYDDTEQHVCKSCHRNILLWEDDYFSPRVGVS